jgi:DNA-binding response OmpR family regulator
MLKDTTVIRFRQPDDPLTELAREGARRMLARQNFRVSPLGDGAALRRLMERELPALVMLDVGLPGEDGFALALAARTERARRHHHGHRRL